MHFPSPISHPEVCPHPDCDVVIREADSTANHPGGACPAHADWFAEEVAACDAGMPVAMAMQVERAIAEAEAEADGQQRLL